jgi:hypothetical protein
MALEKTELHTLEFIRNRLRVNHLKNGEVPKFPALTLLVVYWHRWQNNEGLMK